MAAVLQYQGVELRQDQRPVLTDVTLTVQSGELVYVTGEVGSGKSSLLKSIYGELAITAGQARVLGTNMRTIKPRRLPALRRKLGIVFQDFRLLRDRTVALNLDFVLRATGWDDAEERAARASEVLALVDLAGKEGSMPHELSGGEQQRVCIARAMLNSPRLLIADEPTANLSADSSRHVMDLLNGIRQSGTAVLLSTHNEQLPQLFPGRVTRCQDGRLTEETKQNE